MSVDGGHELPGFDTRREPTERLGPYRLLDILGSGGMGEVWLAEQLEPIRREVAIKLLHPGVQPRNVVARFEAERQMLALMDHPNIARVFDAGVTQGGRPYFVMELVRGVPITDYCDAKRLTTRARLEMFIAVCRAVQHAHQKAIIHRDLKPSNILVTVDGAGPVPKIIDFGIAKALGGQWLTDKTLHTRLGQALGTPAYMSPEQAATSGMDVDTRADIYSLGVMLYELLIGTLPFDPAPGGPLEYAISAHEVVRPSARVKTLGTRDSVAHFRGTSTDDLHRELRGDLDWIVLRAMEKDRTRRYDTANGLAMDLQRFLHHEPIVARPPTTAYRVRKFARRHRVATVAVVLAFVALTAGAAAATIGFVRARSSEATARREAATAQEVSTFLVELFEVNDPAQSRGNVVTAREILDRGAARVRANLRTEPSVRARLLHTMGKVYASLGLYEQGETLVREALAARARTSGPRLDVAATTGDLGSILFARGKTDEADSLFRAALSMDSHGDRLPAALIAGLIASLASVEMQRMRLHAADTLLRTALRIQESAPKPDSSAIAATLASLAWLHDDDPVNYEPVLRRAYEMDRRVRGADHPRVLGRGASLAVMLSGMGRFEEASALIDEVHRGCERVLGPTHPLTGGSLETAGLVRLERGDATGAIPLLHRAIGILQRHDTARAALAQQYLGRAYLRVGDVAEAERLLSQSLAVLSRTRGPAHNWTSQARLGVGMAHARRERYADAERELREALRNQERSFGPTHRRLVEILAPLAEVYRETSRNEDADSMYRRAIQVADASLVAMHPHRVAIRKSYANHLRATSRTRVADSVERNMPFNGSGISAFAVP